MSQEEYVLVTPLDVVPSVCGCTLFLRAAGKIFAINMDFAKFDLLKFALNRTVSPRPTTYEFFSHCLESVGCLMPRLDFYNEDGGVFYCKVTLALKETFDNRISEVDARPSDAIPLALRCSAPMYINTELLDRLPDATQMFAEMKDNPRP